MGTITKGILGGFSGTVGTVVGANWRGKDIIRSRPKKTEKIPTEKQVLQQAKFKLAVQFLTPLKMIVSQHFGSSNGVKSRVNLAVSYTINEAMQVIADFPELVYNKILITKGDLTGFQNPVVVAQPTAVLDFSWDDNSLMGNAKSTDLVSIIVYCKDLNTFEIFQSIADRAALTTNVTLPAFYMGKQVEVWAFMNDEKQTMACNSPYLGTYTVI